MEIVPRARRGDFHLGFEIQPPSVLNQPRDADPGNLSLEKIAHVRLMGFEPQHKISLTEVVPVNVFDQRLPEVGLNFSRQRFSVGKGEVIEKYRLA